MSAVITSTGAMPSAGVTVVVPTYNRADSLRATLATLGAQEVPPGLRWDIVVVNNNSRDHTPRVVEEFGRTASVPVHYLFEGKAGKSRALNAGIALATHDFLLFTDDDVLTSRAWVASAVLAMARWGVDGVGGRILLKWPVPPPRWPGEERGCAAESRAHGLRAASGHRSARPRSGGRVRISMWCSGRYRKAGRSCTTRRCRLAHGGAGAHAPLAPEPRADSADSRIHYPDRQARRVRGHLVRRSRGDEDGVAQKIDSFRKRSIPCRSWPRSIRAAAWRSAFVDESRKSRQRQTKFNGFWN
jgi:glycosyltransferase involved in cell wall biosynthesis